HGADGGFGLGLGNFVLIGNVTLLWAYTLSCHSCRHVTGGRLKHFSAHPIRYKFWTFVSKLSTRHMELAWITLGTLVLNDLYVLLVSSDTISDLRFNHCPAPASGVLPVTPEVERHAYDALVSGGGRAGLRGVVEARE